MAQTAMNTEPQGGTDAVAYLGGYMEHLGID